MISTLVISFDIDFKNISEGLTRDKSRKPNLQKNSKSRNKQLHHWTTKQKTKNNPWILFLKDPSGAFSKPIQTLFIYDPQEKKEIKKKREIHRKRKGENVTLLAM